MRKIIAVGGQPGTGKSSLGFLVASVTKRPIYTINLSCIRSDSDLMLAILRSDKDCIILLEDIDCATNSSTSRELKSDSDEMSFGVTMAGLLNALDGIMTPDHRIFIMTSNYPDRLDPALIRPGRADVHLSIDYLEPEAQCRMYKNFYNDEFLPFTTPISPAKLQEAFSRFPDDGQAARNFIKQQLELQ